LYHNANRHQRRPALWLLHLPHDHTAESVQGHHRRQDHRPARATASLLDVGSGSERANHQAIAALTDLDIYCCDPHSPWRRGSNENTNGTLRQYFPKGTDLSVYGEHYLDYVAAELNGRPATHSTGKPWPMLSTNYSQYHPLLHRPLETASLPGNIWRSYRRARRVLSIFAISRHHDRLHTFDLAGQRLVQQLDDGTLVTNVGQIPVVTS